MLFKADSLDDALGDVVRSLLRRGTAIRAKKGRAREFTGVLIKLSVVQGSASDRGCLR